MNVSENTYPIFNYIFKDYEASDINDWHAKVLLSIHCYYLMTQNVIWVSRGHLIKNTPKPLFLLLWTKSQPLLNEFVSCNNKVMLLQRERVTCCARSRVSTFSKSLPKNDFQTVMGSIRFCLLKKKKYVSKQPAQTCLFFLNCISTISTDVAFIFQKYCYIFSIYI